MQRVNFKTDIAADSDIVENGVISGVISGVINGVIKVVQK
jgi:hypothetical protein